VIGKKYIGVKDMIVILEEYRRELEKNKESANSPQLE